jgi:hypothetical protein
MVQKAQHKVMSLADGDEPSAFADIPPYVFILTVSRMKLHTSHGLVVLHHSPHCAASSAPPAHVNLYTYVCM